jgi:hypothetical protein
MNSILNGVASIHGVALQHPWIPTLPSIELGTRHLQPQACQPAQHIPLL